MRVAFVGSADPFLSTYPPGGGIESQIWGLGRELIRRGHEVHVLERLRGAPTREVEGMVLHGVPDSGLADPFLSFLLISRRSVAVLEAIEPDALYLAERFTALFPSRLPVPKVFATHNRDAFNYYGAYAVKRNPLNVGFFPFKQWVERQVMSGCDLVCPLTPSLEALVRAWGFHRTRVIPNAVASGEYRDEGDGGFLFCSGQLRRVKAVDLLLRAFDELPPTYDEYDLLIGGTGPDEGRLRALAARLRKKDRVRFLGWLPRPRYLDLLARCSLFVLPSQFETFGIVLLEAMAAGKAVVAPRIIGPADLVQEGTTGLLFEPGDGASLRRCMERLLADPSSRQRMGIGGRRTVEEYYDFRVTTSLLAATFKEIVDGGGRTRLGHG